MTTTKEQVYDDFRKYASDAFARLGDRQDDAVETMMSANALAMIFLDICKVHAEDEPEELVKILESVMALADTLAKMLWMLRMTMGDAGAYKELEKGFLASIVGEGDGRTEAFYKQHPEFKRRP